MGNIITTPLKITQVASYWEEVCLKRKVFAGLRRDSKDGARLASCGREFQSLGAATEMGLYRVAMKQYSGTSLNDNLTKRQIRMMMRFCDHYSDSQNNDSNGQFSLDDDLVCASRTIFSQDDDFYSWLVASQNGFSMFSGHMLCRTAILTADQRLQNGFPMGDFCWTTRYFPIGTH